MTDLPDVTLRPRGTAARGGDDLGISIKRPAVLWAGQRIPLTDQPVTIGSDPKCRINIVNSYVAPQHAWVEKRGPAHWIFDNNTVTGTYLNGECLIGEGRALKAGDAVLVGGEILHFITFDHKASNTLVVELPPPDAAAPRAIRMRRDRVTIGRAEGVDIPLDHPSVARLHAEIVTSPQGPKIRDLSAGAGTRVNGLPVKTGFLKVGDEIGVGPYRLVFDGAHLVARDESAGLRLDANALTVDVKGKRILDHASVSVRPGELVAIIGESGAGKSTMIKLLAGVTRPTGGQVLVNGEDVAGRLTDIGYVPQDEIVHGKLTVTEALGYAARLRLPQDSTPADRAAAVQRVLGELGLEQHAATRIERLSGGQRKRVGVATELLSRPGLLFLDEPTTGLDPGLERRMMELFRSLASDSRAVLLVTHATRSLALCDKLAVMGRGGHLCFYGPPADALKFFGVEHADDLYTALDAHPAAEWRAAFDAQRSGRDSRVGWQQMDASLAHPHHYGVMPTRPLVKKPNPIPQALCLSERYAKLFLRDRRNLIIVFAQVPLIALAIAGMFKGGIFSRTTPRAQEAAQLLFLLVTTVVWFGAIDAAREVIKERGVLLRELAVGVRIRAYLASKAAILLSLATLQSLLLALVVFGIRPLEDSGAGAVLGVVLIMIVAAGAAVGMGLVVSALVSSEDQASSFIPLLLIPQLLFGGAIVPVATLSEPVQTLSGVFFAQWAFAGAGTVADMNPRKAEDGVFAAVDRYGNDFFDLPVPVTLLILLFFMALFFAATGALVRRAASAG